MESKFSLLVSDLRIWVHLGCGEEEKKHPQLVSLDIEVVFSSMPDAIFTDNIDDTVCYLAISESIQQLCNQTRFNLIEYMSKEVHNSVSKALLSKFGIVSLIKVSLRKVSPPVPGLHGGVFAIYSAPPAG